MHSQLLLTLLFTLLALAIAFPSSSSSTTTTETLDNLPLPAVPYLIDDTSSSASFPTLTTTPFTEGSGNEVTPGLFTSGNITGMDDFDGWYKCETSWGSPRVDDIDGTANKLNALGYQHCRQTNRGGSMCTKMVHFWSAAVSVCGPLGHYIFCFRVAFAANTIAHRCAWNGLAGGYFVFDDPGALTFPIHWNN